MKIRFEQPREAAILSIDLNLTFVSNFNLGLFIIGNTVGGKKTKRSTRIIWGSTRVTKDKSAIDRPE